MFFVGRQTQARVIDEKTRARCKSLPDASGVWRRVHAARAARKNARSQHERDAARTRVKLQQSLFVVEPIANYLVPGTRHTAQVHMPGGALHHHVKGHHRAGLRRRGGLRRFLKEPHLVLT